MTDEKTPEKVQENSDKLTVFTKVSDSVAVRFPLTDELKIGEIKYGIYSVEESSEVFVLDEKEANITEVGNSQYFLIPEPTITAHAWLNQFRGNLFDVYVNDDQKSVKFILKKYKKK